MRLLITAEYEWKSIGLHGRTTPGRCTGAKHTVYSSYPPFNLDLTVRIRTN
jgi:hypothetical protein